ncbi:FecR family protein [Parabacteroides timonensis]|uniref:FecR family protein n=1 Tax=Parabacteroides timonensis TaxID=1871013 RepID=UPI00094E0E83|nr:FecR family protein [Parabacteroides timonensis]
MTSIPQDIIIRSIRKTATEAELNTLNQWLKEDRKNVEYYYQLEEIWSLRTELSKETINKGWEKVSAEIMKRSLSIVPPKRKSFIWLRYAAAMFIGIIIASAAWINLPVKEKVPDQSVLVQNVVYNRTGVQSILLPDQSEVWINEHTKITYPEEFNGQKRIIALEGKAYFDIQKNKEKPFVVQIGEVEVEVTGTEFFVDSFSEEESLVTLITGGVNLNYKNIEGKCISKVLIPGQQANINRQNGDIKITVVDTGYYVAWKDGTYRFTDETLEKIAGLLAKHFDLDFQISASLRNKRFTGRVTPEQSIEDVLTSISKSYSVKYQIIGKSVKINPR